MSEHKDNQPSAGPGASRISEPLLARSEPVEPASLADAGTTATPDSHRTEPTYFAGSAIPLRSAGRGNSLSSEGTKWPGRAPDVLIPSRQILRCWNVST